MIRSMRKTLFVTLWIVLICVASHATTPDRQGSGEAVSWTGGVYPAALVVGGFTNFTLSPACMRAVVVAAVACSQVGLAGLAGCGLLVHMAHGICR